MLQIQIIALIVLLFLSAFFSGIETALVSMNIIKVKALLKQKKKNADILHRIKQNPHRLIITLLIGNNLANISAASLATVIFTNLFGSSGVGIATGTMTFLILVFGEITPKTFATQNAEKISLLMARPIEILAYTFHPLVIFFELISKGMLMLLGSKKEKNLSDDEIKTMVTMGVKEGILNREAAEIMHNVLEFEGTRVTEIMTPKATIEFIDGDKKLKEVLDFIVKTPYSKYPVYAKSPNNIIGLLDVDEVLKQTKNKKLNIKIKSIIKPIFFVPTSKKINDLLIEFEGKKTPMSVVVDEYGNVAGLVTIEDILEEIVGDIFDKSKREHVHIKKINKKLIRADARSTVEELNRVLHLGIKEEKFNTIAGFIEHKLQKIPKKGERIVLRNIIIEVDKATKQGIKSVNIIKT